MWRRGEQFAGKHVRGGGWFDDRHKMASLGFVDTGWKVVIFNDRDVCLRVIREVLAAVASYTPEFALDFSFFYENCWT